MSSGVTHTFPSVRPVACMHSGTEEFKQDTGREKDEAICNPQQQQQQQQQKATYIHTCLPYWFSTRVRTDSVVYPRADRRQE
jgi:hypothetical protein